MIIKSLLMIICITLPISVEATAHIDIYGIPDQNVKKIMARHGKEFNEFESALQKEAQVGSSENSNAPDSQLVKEIKKRRLDIIDKLVKENGFLYVDFQVIYYPDNKQFYTTIEIIDKLHPERLRFLNQEKKSNVTRKPHKPDLIESMITYEKIGEGLMFSYDFKFKCPVYHCTIGFKHPKLKPYLKVFNEGVVKDKTLILNTLNQDADPERRAAAAFLVGHFKNPKEIIAVLTRHVEDKNDGVRNNVMRVIGVTITKAKISQLNIIPFLDMLDSPYATDRNKALVILLHAANSNVAKHLIFQKGKDKLLSLLRLTQPNNHDWAYLVLKKISGKDFGSTNLAAWRAWVTAAKQSA